MAASKHASVDILSLRSDDGPQLVTDLSADELAELYIISSTARNQSAENIAPNAVWSHGDDMHDTDDTVGRLVLATLHKANAVNWIGASAGLAFDADSQLPEEEKDRLFLQRRALYVRSYLDELGLRSIPVAYGLAERVPDPQTGKIWMPRTKDYERAVKMTATSDRADLPTFEKAFCKIVNDFDSSGRKITLVWTAGYETLADQVEQHPETLNSKHIDCFYSQGGTLLDAEGVLRPRADASNHKFDREGTERVFAHLSHKGVDTRSFAKECAYAITDIRLKHYAKLADTGHLCGEALNQLAEGMSKRYYDDSKDPKTQQGPIDPEYYLRNFLACTTDGEKELVRQSLSESASGKPPHWDKLKHLVKVPPYDAWPVLASAGDDYAKALGLFTSVLKAITLAPLLLSNAEKLLDECNHTSGFANIGEYRLEMTKGENGEWTFGVTKRIDLDTAGPSSLKRKHLEADSVE